jgi:histidine triad (HIT) family protein
MTLFSKIIQGLIPSYRIAEDDFFFAFLDIHPLREGHVLIIPKAEIDKFFDLKEEYLSRILVFAQPIARAIEQSFSCNRCGMAVIGLEVPHAHLHLVPIDQMDDLNFSRPKLSLSKEEFRSVQEKIIRNLKK